MQAIILAAGYGRRMQPLSDDCHKALLPVAGVTILGRIVDSLLDIDVADVIVVTGYRARDIRLFLTQHYAGLRLTFVHNDRYAETNNIVSLSMALDVADPDEDVVLIECDLIYERTLLRRLTGPGRGNVALVDRYRAGMDGTVVAVDDGVVTQVFPPHLQGPEFSFSGKYKTLNIYRFDACFCRTTLQPLLNCYANLIDGSCYYELVLGMLINMQRQRIAAVVVDGSSWAEVDDPNDLAVARFQFDREQRGAILDRAFGGYWSFDVLDFSFMRNAYFPTDAMLAAFRQALPALLRNYGSAQEVLNEKLSYVVGCPADRLQVLNGASQIFPMLPAILGGGTVAIPAPTFGEYPRWLPAARTYADGDHATVAEDVDTLVIVTPNSPTGHEVAAGWIHGLAARRPGLRVVVDESFIDFSDQPSIVPLLEREPLENVLVIKSLSKSLGVPGLRLGYVYTRNAALLAGVAARLPVWNLSAPAEFFLELMLKHRTDFEASLRRTRDDRRAFAAALAELAMVDRVVEGGGNFLLVHLRGSDPALAAGVRRMLLAEHGIEVKDVSAKFSPPLPSLRVALRLPAENALLAAALAGVEASAS